MNKIDYSPRALQDMDDIWDYIAKELKNPIAAKRTIDRITTDISRLKQSPFMGPALSSISSFDSDFRFLVSGNYMVFYQVDDAVITVARVLYGRRNYPELLFGDTGLSEDEE